MHELSICQSLLRQVEQIARHRGATLVSSITVRIGPLSGVEADLLQRIFPLACRDTLAAGAELIVEAMPVRVRCDLCSAETETSPRRLRCGACASSLTRLVSGDECLLASIEIVGHSGPQ